MKRRLISISILLLLLVSTTTSAFAQTYLFSLDEQVVHVFWNEDGTLAVDYNFTFTNDPSADSLDVVDVGLPNKNYVLSSVKADVGGKPVSRIEDSPYVTGVAVELGNNSIPAGKTGTVHVYVGTVKKVLYPDDNDKDYISGVFSPTWFDSKYVNGQTKTTVTFHLPPGVQPEEPRWHSAPAGFPTEPQTSMDEQGRVTYTWQNDHANGYTQYKFGASFPAKYIPDSAVTRPDPYAWVYAIIGGFLSILPCLIFIGIFVLIMVFSVRAARRRSMAYLPPAISIEGHGIKRGLTPVEAGLLMELPTDKILTMILFSLIKKSAAKVTKRDPLEIEAIDPRPQGLYQYEEQFLDAFTTAGEKGKQRKALQNMMVDLVKSLAAKMKGFSRKETVAYYKEIMNKAWAQIESADTPEVKSAKYDEVMDWTMLDKDFEDHTRDVFHGGPVILPTWWGHYDPVFSSSIPHTGHLASSPVQPSSPVSSEGGKISMPTLPGADFAAGMVMGMQNMATSVVGNISDFTSRVTNITNPAPKYTSSSRGGGGGGHSCACACACAGCACACAGGGR